MTNIVHHIEVETPAGAWMRCPQEFWQDVDAVAFACKNTTTRWRVVNGARTVATGRARSRD